MRLRHPVAIPLLVALLMAGLLVGVGLAAVSASNQTVLVDAQGRVRSNRDAAVRAITQQGAEFQRTLAVFASAPRIVGALASPTAGSLQGAQVALSTLGRSKDSPSAFVTDLRGRLVALSPAQPELIGRDFSFRDWFQGVSRTGRPYVSTGFRTAATGNPLVVAVSSPVSDGSRRVGYLTLLWQLESIQDVATGARRDDGVVITVTDQRGQPLTNSLPVDQRGQPVAPTIPESTKAALAGRTVETVTSDTVAATGPVPGFGWTVSAKQPTTVALAPAAEFRRTLGLALGASWLLVTLITVFAIRVSRHRAAEQALADDQRRHLAALFAASPIGILETLPDGTIVAANKALALMLGYGVEDLLEINGADLVHPDCEVAAKADVQRVLDAGAEGYTSERVYLARDGSPVSVLVSVIATRNKDAGAQQLIAFVVDQRPQKAALESVRASDNRFRRIFDEGLVGALLVDARGAIIDVNTSMERILECEREDLVGGALVDCFTDEADRCRIASVLAGNDIESQLRAELGMTATDGRAVWAQVALSWLMDQGGERMFLAQVEDITARRVAEQRLKELALHDELTGLPNRRLLLERCDRAFAVARSTRTTNTRVAALFIDLDGFKPVNDRSGHAVGDQLLRDIAHDLAAALRPTDTVARVGGDEFVVLLEQLTDQDDVRVVADRIASTVRRQTPAGGALLQVTASVGIAVADLAREPDISPDQLLRRADSAMYRAKERGRDRHDMFDADLEDASESRHVLEQAIRTGLSEGRISLIFQSVIDVDKGAVVGAEALLRLTDAEGRLLPTLPAIIAAEGAGLAGQVGERVLDLALAAASSWPAHLDVAVNISARELTDQGLRQRVEQALARHDFDPVRLVLEITESSIRNAGPSALAELDRLRHQGIKVAIDDFGTAYATLQNLTTLPVDMLKVDASFTAGLPDQRVHVAVVHGIASIAHELGIPCVVEGVETQAQLDAVTGMGVLAQGWFWGQPQGADHVPGVRGDIPSAPRADEDRV